MTKFPETIIEIIIVIICIIIIGILVEKVIHPNFNATEATRQFKKDFGSIVHVLFSKETLRHVFDASLWEHFHGILKEYRHDAFAPSLQADFYDSTPRICITFVPNRELTAEELNRLCQLLRLKMNQYLQLYGLCWQKFAEYHVLDGTVIINIFYSEFKEDLQPFLKRYRISVKHKATGNYGVLHDESLDKEINNDRTGH